jgi:hypothetical protein
MRCTIWDGEGEATGPAVVELSDIAARNGKDGFALRGVAAPSSARRAVACAGDANGDGYDDIIVGAPRADANADCSGSSYVVFRTAGGFGAAALGLGKLIPDDGHAVRRLKHGL